MNNSNNMFDNNGITPQQPSNIPNENIATTSLQNETSINKNVAPTQQQNNSFNQPNNDYISNDFNDINSTIANPTTVNNKINPQQNQSFGNVGQNYASNTNVNSTLNNINSMNSAVANPTTVNNQINPQQNQSFNNVGQNYTSNTNFNNDELLRAFIGNNYEKITTRPFNFAGFFFTTFYMFYRKMFLYGILLFIVNLIISSFIIKNSFIVSILLGIVVGFLINKVYLYYAKKKINKIKLENPQKSNEELKNICSNNGGTSVGKIFLGFLAQFGIAFVAIIIMMFMGLNSFFGNLFNFDNWNIIINGNKINNSDQDTNSSSASITGTLVENVTISGYSCIGSKCTISIENSDGTTTDYTMNSTDELFLILKDYKEYIKINIYYTSKGSEKTISGYKIYLKSNNEDISSIKTENELRDKIGLYSLGSHTDTLTLKEIGMTGFEFNDDATYTYTTYKFVDSKNVEYEMKYINSNGDLNLTEGNKYTVTFEVVEGTFDYEFNIKSVK